MHHQIRTSSARHPNFSRDLVCEPLSREEWSQLMAWQELQASGKILNIPQRSCVICGKGVPMVRRADSTTCSGGCAAKLCQRTRRRKAA